MGKSMLAVLLFVLMVGGFADADPADVFTSHTAGF
jgi:hypothetical protein